MKNLHWFRADLRITDNTALIEACKQANTVIALFIITPKTWQQHDAAGSKMHFLLENLQTLSDDLKKLGIPLLIKKTDAFSGCAKVISTLCKTHKIDTVYANAQYELDEKHRDNAVKQQLKKQGVDFQLLHDQCVLAPGSVLSQKQEPMKVFTPFKKVWLKQAWQSQAFLAKNAPRKKFKATASPSKIPKSVTGFKNPISLQDWPAGEAAAKKRLNTFCKTALTDYQTDRDFPALSATSQLSAYLTQGVLSPRQCIKAILQHLKTDNFQHIQKQAGANVWLSELIWRDFYKHIVFHFPQVCCHKPFNPKTNKIPWRNNKKHFTAWCEGKTGFPLVDAAMRQLNETGWMHNRLRMVVSMFLTKTLFIDWRLGEAYFMQQLIDGDFAANNGGWQWSASTGTDAAPYFRIFNPTTQSERFDPDGTFIKTYCPELSEITGKKIHAPGADYIKPIVDYKKMRDLVIKTFKQKLR